MQEYVISLVLTGSLQPTAFKPVKAQGSSYNFCQCIIEFGEKSEVFINMELALKHVKKRFGYVSWL